MFWKKKSKKIGYLQFGKLKLGPMSVRMHNLASLTPDVSVIIKF
jgi:hypothetical protein